MSKVPTPRRVLVIGDIHGSFRGLQQALERSGYDHKQDQLIQLGDVCDGWSETPETVDYLLELEKQK